MIGNHLPTQNTTDFREAPDFRGAGDLTRAIRAPFYLFVPLAFGLLALVLYPWHRYLTFTVEIDFPRYAAHARALGEVLTWHPYVPFGYPLLLWTLTQTGLSVLTAGQGLAGFSMVIGLGLIYALARRFLPRPQSVLVQVLCALNWHFAQSGILCGTDLPWVTLQLGSFICLFRALEQPLPGRALLAGLTLGLAFDIRYQSLIALPWMGIFIFFAWLRTPGLGKALVGAFALAFGFFAAAAPQLAINLSQKHSLLTTDLASNVWMGMYGDGNFTQSWSESEKHSDLIGIIQQDPHTFLRHWVKEGGMVSLRLPLLALGIQPVLLTLEPEPTLRLILLALLGIGGLIGGIGLALGPLRSVQVHWPSRPTIFLIGYVVLYGAAVALAYSSFRYLLPLAPLTILALVKVIHFLQPKPGIRKLLAPASLVLAMTFLSAWGFYVTLERFQCRVQEVQAAIAKQLPGEIRIVSNRADLYAFHLPYHWINLPFQVQTPEQLKEFALAARINYFLFEEAHSRSKEPENWPQLLTWALNQKTIYARNRYPEMMLISLASR